MPDRRVKWTDWMDRKTAAKYIGLSDFWLEKHAKNVDAPRYIKYGRKCWYKRSELDRWLENHEGISNSGPGGSSVFEDYWTMGFKRKVDPPNFDRLEKVWAAEIEKDVEPETKRLQRLWLSLKKTLTTEEQKKLVAELEKK